MLFTQHHQNQTDVMNALGAMHQKYWYVEVHARGRYPSSYLERNSKEKDMISLLKKIRKILAQGKVDYIGFSYYMSVLLQNIKDVMKKHMIISVRTLFEILI